MTHPARLVRWAVEHANVTYLGASSKKFASISCQAFMALSNVVKRSVLCSLSLLWTRQQMMEDMTHVQMSLAYTLRHLTSVLSAMLWNIWGRLKYLEWTTDIWSSYTLVENRLKKSQWITKPKKIALFTHVNIQTSLRHICCPKRIIGKRLA